MLRKKAVALALSMLMPTVASALGLGALKASSGLNQPFDGRIEILGATAADYDTLSIKLADTQQFDRAGVLREAVLLSLKFEIVETPAGNDFIRVSTRDPVREPFLNFLLELNWANGRMVREYTVLLDPPLYDPNRRAPAPTYAPAPRAAAPAPMAAPAPRASVPAAPMPPMAADGTLGTVQSSDTAWGLAMRHRPDAGVSVQRMMIALLRANPEAFANGNVNQLRRGAVLRMPAQADIDALSQSEALAEVSRQHQLWEEYRQGATSAAPAQPMGAPATPPAAADDELDAALADDAAKPEDDARLELVTPEGADDAAGAPGAGDATDQAAKPDTAAEDATSEALAAEAQTTQESADAELQAKLDEASEIIDLLQRQVEIKDEELASLQARLAELGVEVPKPAPPADAPATDIVPDASAPATEAGATDETVTPDVTPDTAAPVAATPAETAATPEPTPPVASAPEEAKPAKPAAPKPVVTPPPPPAGMLDSLVPAHLRDAVPGGAVTIVGVLGSLLLLGLAALGKALKSRSGNAITPTARPAVAAATAAAVAAPAAAAAEATVSPGDTVVPELDDTADQFTRTLEATAEQLQSDPLEEVNVYLAYERFDQAEELVKQVIAQYPNEHKYKLRLLEIYYSANNKQAYEDHARELLDAVGDHHPLWENAVAMWTEMSPSRALFAAPGAAEAAAPADAAASKEFVDVTGEATSPGGATMTMGPGEDGPLAVTAVGLSNDYASDDSVLDFDLTSTSTDTDFEPMLDLTSGEPTAGGGVIDLTATVEQLEKSGILDLTSLDAAPDTHDDMFDISGLSESGDAGSLTDLSFDAPDTGAEEPHEAATADLLDITTTGNVAFEPDEAILSITAGSLADTASGARLATDAVGDADELNLDFDISDTVAPRLDAEQGPSQAAIDTDADTDITRNLPAEEPLDFDIEGLGLELSAADAALAEGDDEFDLTAEGDEFSLDLNAEAGADLDLSLTNPGLNMQIADGLSATSGGAGASDDESDIEFDLALQDTTDFDKLDIDDTLELPKSSTARLGGEPMAESLEDLTRSMEASLAGLDLDEEPSDDGLLDLELGSLDGESIDLDFSIDDGTLDDAHDTLSIDPEELSLERTGMHIDKTVVMPRDDSVEYQSESDEVDTKLNLAKAYIELGDSDGARAILDEVTREGTDGQQQEAQHLLSQLS